jgi:hypothetical protein
VSQTTSKDVIYLKNGSIIKGEIVEQVPGKQIKIRTADGNIMAYNLDEIEKITKETGEAIEMTPAPAVPEEKPAAEPAPKIRFGIIGGITFPVGELGATDATKDGSGFAKMGYAGGAELRVPIQQAGFWTTTGMYTINAVDEDAYKKAVGNPSGLTVETKSWTSIVALTGLGAHIVASSVIDLYLAAQAGALFGSSPEMKAAYQGRTATQGSANATSFAYSVYGGALFGNMLSVDARYLGAKPKYKVTIIGTNGTSTMEYEQPTALFKIIAGIWF